MKKSSLMAPLIWVLLLPASASADWQYARWGMTAEALVSASSGAAKLAPEPYAFPDGKTIRATAGFTSSAGTFEADFLFDPSGGLVQINLSQHSNVTCGNTLRVLTEKYGPPANPDSKTSVWQDRQGGNVITWSDTSAINRISGNDIEPDCAVTYKPLGKGDDGL